MDCAMRYHKYRTESQGGVFTNPLTPGKPFTRHKTLSEKKKKKEKHIFGVVKIENVSYTKVENMSDMKLVS